MSSLLCEFGEIIKAHVYVYFRAMYKSYHHIVLSIHKDLRCVWKGGGQKKNLHIIRVLFVFVIKLEYVEIIELYLKFCLLNGEILVSSKQNMEAVKNISYVFITLISVVKFIKMLKGYFYILHLKI